MLFGEMFGNRMVLMGEWKARYQMFPTGDQQWKLFNIVQDIREATDVSNEHPDILEKMVSAYDKWAQDVEIIVPEYSEEQQKTGGEMISLSNQTEVDPGFPIEE
jgi:arylsulfatase